MRGILKFGNTCLKKIIALLSLLSLFCLLAWQSDLAYHVAQKRMVLFGRYNEAYTVLLFFAALISFWLCFAAITDRKLNPLANLSKTTLFKLTALFLSFLIALIFADLLLRIRKNRFYVFSDDVTYYHRLPNQRYQGSFRDRPKYPFSYPRSRFDAEELTFNFTIDAYGFRNRVPAERYSWIAVGDSFTEGSLVSDEEVWVDRLSQKLDFPVYNCGISGSSPLNYLAFFSKHGKNIAADGALFVLYEGNDFRDSNYRAEKKGKVSCYSLPLRYLRSTPLRPPLKRLAAKYFAVIGSRRFANDASVKDSEHPMYPVSWLPFVVNQEKQNAFAFDVKSLQEHLKNEELLQKSKGYRETIRLIKEFQLLCLKEKKKMILVYAPDLPHVIMPEICRKVSEKQLHAFLATRKSARGENLKEKLLRNSEAKERLLKEFCQKEEIEFLSLTEVLREKTCEGIQTYYCYDQHWTAAGHKVVAEFLAEKLQSQQ